MPKAKAKAKARKMARKKAANALSVFLFTGR
jgi:hypothetical protein